MEAFVDAVRRDDPSRVLSGPEESLESHRMAFAAERSRMEHRVEGMVDELDRTGARLYGVVRELRCQSMGREGVLNLAEDGKPIRAEQGTPAAPHAEQ